MACRGENLKEAHCKLTNGYLVLIVQLVAFNTVYIQAYIQLPCKFL